jgi:NADPH:quinone reductase-like Zn-dependent oxidoreductase
MRAVAFTHFGAAPALTELPVPEPRSGEVLVRLRTSSVNGFDTAPPLSAVTPDRAE